MPINFDDNEGLVVEPETLTDITFPREEKIPEPVDTYVGSSREEEQIRHFQADQATERLLNDQTDAELRQAVAMLMAKVERQDQLLRQVGRNFGGIVFPEEAANSGFSAMEGELRRQLAGKQKAKVLIHTSERLNENWNVPLLVNGRHPKGFEKGVPRGQVVELDIAFVELLQHAVISGYQKIVDADGDPKWVHVHQLRYPFTILS